MIAIIVAFGSVAVWTLAAQEPRLAFDVASVKRNVSGEPGFGGPPAISGSTANGYRATNVTLPMLIGTAYGFDRDKIVGAPGWAQSQRYDIAATAGREVTRVEASAMLRTLLEERFKLIVATEQRERDAYTLRLARADGRLGPDLHKAADDCFEKRPADAVTRLLAAARSQPQPSNGLRPSSGNVCATIESVAGNVGRALNATVIEETGLKGRWDFVIAHSGLQSEMRPARDGSIREYPSIFAAVEEQLGLKVERRREPAPFDVLVIKSVERSTDN